MSRCLDAVRQGWAFPDAQKLDDDQTAFVEQAPIANDALRQELMLPLLGAEDVEGLLRFKAIVFTKDHGAYKFDEVSLVDRFRSSPKAGYITLGFKPRFAAFACTVLNFKVLSAGGIAIGQHPNPAWLQTGDLLRTFYTVRIP